jgi:hypothetical protein
LRQRDAVVPAIYSRCLIPASINRDDVPQNISAIQGLAMGTKMTAALTDNDAGNPCLAAAAFFPFPAIDLQEILIASGSPFSIDEILERSPSILQTQL